MRSSEKNLSQKYMGDKHCPVVQQKSTQNFKQFSSKLKKKYQIKKNKTKNKQKKPHWHVLQGTFVFHKPWCCDLVATN